MAYVITDSCAGTCDAACTRVCPMDCIAGPVPLDELALLSPAARAARVAGLQLYIDPDGCIDCGACEPECPVNAIYPDDAVPERDADAPARNAAFFARG